MEYDLTTGEPFKKIINFAFPLLLGNVFQQLYNIVDIAVVSRSLGSNAVAAIGSTSAIFGLLLSVSQGMTNGFSIIVAKTKHNMVQLRKTINTFISLFFILSLLLTLICLCSRKSVIKFLDVPHDILFQSEVYINIITNFIVITFFYNVMSGLLRGLGNSLVPLIALIFSSLLHIVLDYTLVVYFKKNIGSVAYATVISQLLSGLICLFYFIYKYKFLGFDAKKYFDKRTFFEILSLGLSIVLTMSIVSLSTVIFQKSINKFDIDIIAACTSARKVEDILIMPLITLSIATATYISQNLGVKNYKRIIQGLRVSFNISFVWSILINISMFFLSKNLIYCITDSRNMNMVNFLIYYLKINLPFFLLLSMVLILRSGLQGVGKKFIPMLSGVTELCLKFILLFIPNINYWHIVFCDPTVWCICLIMVCYGFYNWEKSIHERNMNL